MYFADTEYYQPMAAHSIKSLNKFSNLPITLFTAYPDHHKEEEYKNVNIIKVKPNAFSTKREEELWANSLATKSKLFSFEMMPYGTTIFLDSDTEFFSDPEELIEGSFDFAACRETMFKDVRQYESIREREPYSRELNAGFMIFKKNKKISALLERAKMIFLELEQKRNDPKSVICPNCGSRPKDHRIPYLCNDQRALNQSLLYDCVLETRIIPGNWNVRTPNYDSFADSYKMLHMHNLNDEKVRNKYVR